MLWTLSLPCVLLLVPASNANCRNFSLKYCNSIKDNCRWTGENWAFFKNDNYCYAYLKDNRSSGTLQLKARCASSSPLGSYCLKFRFFLNTSEENTLTVSIVRPPNNAKTLLWSYSTRTTGWTDAAVPVPVTSSSPLNLSISARRKDAKKKQDIRIGKVSFKQQACNITPSAAKPTTTGPPAPTASTTSSTATKTTLTTTTPTTTTKTTTTTLATTTTTLATTTTPTTTAAPEVTTTMTKATSQTTNPPTPTTESATNIAVNPTADNHETDAVTSSNDLGAIVGVFVSVFVAVVIGVVIFLAFRRKLLPLTTVFFTKKRKGSVPKGNSNGAFESEGKNYTDLNTNSTPITKCPDTSTSQEDFGLRNDDYSVIIDVGIDVTSSAFQPMTSLYCKAQVLHSMHKEDKASEPKVSPEDANLYEVVDEELGHCQADVHSRNVKYKNLPADKTHQKEKRSDCKENSNPKIHNDETSLVYSLAKPLAPKCALGQPTQINNGDMKGVEVRKPDRGGYTQARGREAGNCNADKTTPTDHQPEAATNVYHILEEDPENSTHQADTCAVYHVLEPDTPGPRSGELTIGVYHILEETETRHQRVSSHQEPCLSEGAESDYHSLDFQKKLRPGDATGDSGDEMGQTYSHLNEAGEDTYSELSREKKRKVLDWNYSHITLE